LRGVCHCGPPQYPSAEGCSALVGRGCCNRRHVLGGDPWPSQIVFVRPHGSASIAAADAGGTVVLEAARKVSETADYLVGVYMYSAGLGAVSVESISYEVADAV
jgi:hypothetical protein